MNREKTTCCCWWWRDVEYRPATIQIIFKAQKSHTKFYIQIRTYSPISPASFFSLFYHSSLIFIILFIRLLFAVSRARFFWYNVVLYVFYGSYFSDVWICVCAQAFFSRWWCRWSPKIKWKKNILSNKMFYSSFAIDHFCCAKSLYWFFVCNPNVPLNELLKELKIAKIHDMISANHMNHSVRRWDDDDSTKPPLLRWMGQRMNEWRTLLPNGSAYKIRELFNVNRRWCISIFGVCTWISPGHSKMMIIEMWPNDFLLTHSFTHWLVLPFIRMPQKQWPKYVNKKT